MTGYVRRFSKTERVLHWVNAAGFLLLLATGLVLYLPSLEVAVGRRTLVKEVHFWGGIGWVCALVLVVLLGDRRGLLRTARELDRFDRCAGREQRGSVCRLGRGRVTVEPRRSVDRPNEMQVSLGVAAEDLALVRRTAFPPTRKRCLKRA